MAANDKHRDQSSQAQPCQFRETILRASILIELSLISPSELTGEAAAPPWCVGSAVASRSGVALSEVARERVTLAPFDDETHRTDTKNNSTNVSDKREASAHTSSLLLPHLPPSNSDKPLIPKMDKKNSMKENKTGQSRSFDSETTSR